MKNHDLFKCNIIVNKINKFLTNSDRLQAGRGKDEEQRGRQEKAEGNKKVEERTGTTPPKVGHQQSGGRRCRAEKSASEWTFRRDFAPTPRLQQPD